MTTSPMVRAVALMEEANASFDPQLMTIEAARQDLALSVRIRRLMDFRVAKLSQKLGGAAELARAMGTSVGQAKEVTATGKVLASSEELSSALKHGDISLDQATEIAAAEESSPGAATELLEVAKNEAFHVLKDKARQAKLEAEQHKDLASLQHRARSARSHVDGLGMVNIHLTLEPHVGVPIAARAEAAAARIAKKARADWERSSTSGSEGGEPFEAYLADAYAALLLGSGQGPTRRPELVVVVSHEVATRGWTDVREGEYCKIPGIGPVTPKVARAIAQDAFLSGVFYDGKDLRHFHRWSRHIPIEVALALELGEPPSFDGVKCVDCGNRFRNEFDHVRPRASRGPTSRANLKPRCWRCHQRKTARDRKAGVLKPPDP